MTDSISCPEAQNLAPEVAIGIASAEDRARVLGHTAGCSACSAMLRELAGVVDDIVALVPFHEPPAGFESEVLARLAEQPAPDVRALTRRGRGRWRVALIAAAALVLGAALSGALVYRIHDADRTLADRLRATLATANGQYFASAHLDDRDGRHRGVLFAYQGEPAWLFLTVSSGEWPAPLTVEAVTHDGAVRPIGRGVDLSGSSFGTVIPVAVHDIAVVRLVDSDGGVILSARPLP